MHSFPLTTCISLLGSVFALPLSLPLPSLPFPSLPLPSHPPSLPPSSSFPLPPTHPQEENYGPLFLGLDKVFLTVFVMEVLVKWYHDFLGFWRVGWNVFDFVIVASSLLGPSESAVKASVH